MKYKLLISLLLTVFSIIGACDFTNFHEAEAKWVKEEPFLIQYYSCNIKNDSVTVNRIIGMVKEKYPGVNFFTSMFDLNRSTHCKEIKAKAPLFQVITGGEHGSHGNIAEFEKRLPALEEAETIFTSPAKKKDNKSSDKKASCTDCSPGGR
ncbi:MAG: hypothetical protein ABIA63_06910 [bacterium]